MHCFQYHNLSLSTQICPRNETEIFFFLWADKNSALPIIAGQINGKPHTALVAFGYSWSIASLMKIVLVVSSRFLKLTKMDTFSLKLQGWKYVNQLWFEEKELKILTYVWATEKKPRVTGLEILSRKKSEGRLKYKGVREGKGILPFEDFGR